MNANFVSVIIAIIATAGLCFGLVGFFDTAPSQAQLHPNESARTISVSGTAEQLVQPDTASLTFRVSQKSPTIEAATNSVNTRTSTLLGFLREFGIEDTDMKTLSYNVNPEYRYEGEFRNRKSDGYRVNQLMQIKIRDLDNVESVLTRIGEIEIDNLSGPNFFIDDDEMIKAGLRKQAIANAKEKAAVLGKDLGVRLRNIVGFHEGGSPASYDYARSKGFGLASDEQVEAEIPAGENLLRASVMLEFEIE